MNDEWGKADGRLTSLPVFHSSFINPHSSFLSSLLFLTDSYKVSHYRQYPPGTERVYSYFESRGGQFPEAVFFGLQYYLRRYLAGQVITAADIDAAESFYQQHFGQPLFNHVGWQHVLEAHGGRLPVRIRAVPEGMVVPAHNVLMTIENTDPACYWLTNWLETVLVQVWYGTTVATQSRAMKKIIHGYLAATGTPRQAGWKLHDFGLRGSSSIETAAVGGAAHLISFHGTDNIAALVLAREHYDCPMAGQSIPAAEHSTITAWGEDHEVDAMRNMLQQFPSGTVAVVSDSFDIYRACSEYWGRQLRDLVLQRDGVLVVRPDSGDPPQMVVRVLELLGEAFGTRQNSQGYRVLDPHVRVIQGDGIDFAMLDTILAALTSRGWSADNVSFGSGGGILQKLNRDTLKFAFKCSSVTIDGQDRDVFKRPVTDRGKQSKAGRLKLVHDGGRLATIAESAPGEDLLQLVFENGAIVQQSRFDEIRDRAAGE
ncbi:MAG TPA: nicotinate phosphoribosyltransferase [Pirellulales bacterium]